MHLLVFCRYFEVITKLGNWENERINFSFNNFDLYSQHLRFTITAVFFNIGINDKATLAEALGETTPQYHSNSDNLDRLNKYYQKYSKIFHEHMTAARGELIGPKKEVVGYFPFKSSQIWLYMVSMHLVLCPVHEYMRWQSRKSWGTNCDVIKKTQRKHLVCMYCCK